MNKALIYIIFGIESIILAGAIFYLARWRARKNRKRFEQMKEELGFEGGASQEDKDGFSYEMGYTEDNETIIFGRLQHASPTPFSITNLEIASSELTYHSGRQIAPKVASDLAERYNISAYRALLAPIIFTPKVVKALKAAPPFIQLLVGRARSTIPSTHWRELGGQKNCSYWSIKVPRRLESSNDLKAYTDFSKELVSAIGNTFPRLQERSYTISTLDELLFQLQTLSGKINIAVVLVACSALASAVIAAVVQR